MSRFLHGALHVLAIALQFVNVTAIPAPYNAAVAAILAALQGGLAIALHSTPTPTK